MSYEGPIPDKRFFDISFSISTQKELDEEFTPWYDSWAGRTDWNFKNELEMYCKNDVDVLCAIVKKHHETCVGVLSRFQEYLAISPWHFPTCRWR